MAKVSISKTYDWYPLIIPASALLQVQRKYLEDCGYFTGVHTLRPVSPSSNPSLEQPPLYPGAADASNTDYSLNMQQASDPLLEFSDDLSLPELHPNDLLSTEKTSKDTGVQSYAAIMEYTRLPNIVKLKQFYLPPHTAVIQCDLDRGHPSSNVTWYKDGTVIDFNSDERITVVNNKHYEQLHIQDFQQSDVGVYQVQAFNNVGSAVSIAVHCNGSSEDLFEGSKPKFTSNPQDHFNVLPGSWVQLSAKATGDNVTYHWKHDGENVIDEKERVTGSTTQVLTISSAELKDEGKFELIACNKHGEVHSTPAYLCIRVVEPCNAQTLVSERSDLYNFISSMEQGIRKEIETLTEYDILPTQAIDESDSSELATEHFHTAHHVDTISTDLKLRTKPTDTSESSRFVVTRRAPRVDSEGLFLKPNPTLLYFNSSNVDNPNLYQFETHKGIGTGIETSTRYDIVPTHAIDNGGSSGLATEHSHTSDNDAEVDLKPAKEATGNDESSELVVTGLMQRLGLPSNNKSNCTISLTRNSEFDSRKRVGEYFTHHLQTQGVSTL